MKQILFIEDDVITSSIYKYHFSSAGYKVKQVDSAELGLAALAAFKPDIVVLDLMLPKMNGVECIKRIRAQAETKTVPIIVFTNTYLSALIAEAEKAGANQCLIKANTSFQHLLSAVAQTFTPHEPGSTTTGAAPSGAADRKPPEPSGSPAIDPLADFLKSTPHMLASLRKFSQTLLRTESAAARLPIVLDLHRGVNGLTSRAALAKAHLFAQMASATEALLKELDEKPKEIGPSTMRTVNQVVEFLTLLFEHVPSSSRTEPAGFKILAVDDEVLSRRAVTKALERAQLNAVGVDSPFAAYELLQKERFDLVVTDVKMPGMDGFELCAKMRALPAHAATPVVFVTSSHGLEARVRSAKSGGDDFIAKPFLFIELAVKALTHVVRGKLESSRAGFQSFHPKA